MGILRSAARETKSEESRTSKASALGALTLGTLLSGFAPAQAADWKLDWAEEFDAPGLPNPAKWKYETGMIRNQEAQYYTSARQENARVENGTLVIESRKERFSNANYTSASIHTNGLASWTFGRIEVRAKLPTGRGMWPAIWTMGTDHSNGGWPNNGEIDIMENVGFDPDRIFANVHTGAYNHVKQTAKGGSMVVRNPGAEFHVYAVEWFKDRIDFYVDTTKYYTFRNEGTGWAAWPYTKPQYLILNAAIGGGWGGQQGIDDAIFPQKYFVDYVRVYSEAGGSNPAALDPRREDMGARRDGKVRLSILPGPDRIFLDGRALRDPPSLDIRDVRGRALRPSGQFHGDHQDVRLLLPR